MKKDINAMSWYQFLQPRVSRKDLRSIVRQLLGPMMTTLTELSTSVASLASAQTELVSLTDALKAKVDALVATPGATPEELAVVQAAVDEVTLALSLAAARNGPV